MRPSPLLALLVLAATPGVGFAQAQLDRRSRDAPDIAVEAGGRVGPCDALLFAPDGRSLLAAGDDKVVRAWPYAAGALDTRPDQMRTVRWPAWREQRGGIKAVALSPDGARVAVGGFGLITSAAAVLDLQTGATVALSWPRSKPGESFGSVTATAFHPDGRRVGFATRDGSVWLWNPVKPEKPDAQNRPSAAPVRVGKHEPLAGPQGQGEFNYPRLVYFPDADTLVSVAQSGQVLACDLRGPATDAPGPPPEARHLFNVNPAAGDRYGVHKAELFGRGKWLVVACIGPQVLLRSTDGKEVVRVPLPKDHFPRSVAVHPKTGRLAVGVGAATPAGQGPRFIADRQIDELWLFDDPTAGGKPEPTKTVQLPGPAEALAFHPADDRLAVAGGDADEVTLLDPGAPEKPVSVARGAGRRLWGVKLSTSGKVLAVQPARDPAATDPNHRGKPDGWAMFDLPRRRPTKDQALTWLEPVVTADGWEVLAHEGDANRPAGWLVRLTRPDTPPVEHKLTLDRARDAYPTCYTFLPAKGTRPTRLLVGHYYGCSLFELSPAGATRTRVFTGHGGEVYSVVAAADQSWFVTSGADQTVAAWSLKDWPSQSGLGAAAAVKDGAVTVAAVDVGSPAWEAGLRVGDAIEKLAVGGVLRYGPGDDGPVGTPAAVMLALADPAPAAELYFTLRSKEGVRRDTLTTVRQRPLWKWFPAFAADGTLAEWTIWMWHGSFYDTSTHGDALVGWHLNAPRVLAGTAVFYRLDQFKKQFHRRLVIDKLVEGRSVADTLRDEEALGPNPLPRSFQLIEPYPIELVVDRSVVGPAGVTAEVTVNPIGDNPDLHPHRVELWVNDHRLRVWKGDGKTPVSQTVEIPPGAFRAGDNRLAVLTFNPEGGRGEKRLTVQNPAPPVPPNMLALAVGVNDYGDHRLALKRSGVRGVEEFTNLRFPAADAKELITRLDDFRGAKKVFPAAPPLLLRLDRDARRAALRDDFRALARKARPDDVLVVFFAGHGCDPDAGLKQVKGERAVGRFVFCCPDYDPGKVADTAMSAEELFDALAGVNCRKLVLLDACHSGGAAEANLIRRLIPDGQGPAVIAACTQRQQSLEHPKLGHGLFTHAVLKALGDDFRRADLNSDGALSPAELYKYVSDTVPTLAEDLFPPGQDGQELPGQTPICFPRDLPTYMVVKR